MSDTVYRSSMGRYMMEFLNHRRSLGYKALDVEFALRSIDKHLQDSGFTGLHMTEQAYEDWWQSTEGQLPRTRYQKASVFIRFLKYMATMGMDCYIPRLPRMKSSGRTPFTFSEEEMCRIFSACDSLRMKERHTESIMICIPALIRLMYSTAVRINEAISIMMRDVDFTHHVIRLIKTKNGHERLAPINSSLETVLRQYISFRDRLPYTNLRHPESPLFVSSRGNPVSRKTVLTYMHRIVADAGIEHKGNEEGPHLHSLRHTACIHSMVKCARNGMDLYCCLPILSVFMGHRKVLDTETYLRLTQEMYPELIKQDLSVTANINRVIKHANLMYDETKD